MAADDTRMTPLRRLVLAIVVLFTAWHVFASFLWIAPPSGLRQAVPGSLLQQYMIPMFGQSWSVFAPEPINGDFRLQVRAVVPDEAGGEAEATDWVDATAAELSMLTHNLTPPRAAIQSTEIASQLFNAFNKLSTEQQDVVALGYYEGGAADWSGRLEEALLATGEDGPARTYLEAEQLVTAYSTQVAHAMWGEDVQQVQFIVSRQNVIPFESRHDPNAERPAVQPAPTGWRGPIVRDGQSQEAFAEVFLRAVEAAQR
jgi:hypothetical protein